MSACTNTTDDGREPLANAAVAQPLMAVRSATSMPHTNRTASALWGYHLAPVCTTFQTNLQNFLPSVCTISRAPVTADRNQISLPKFSSSPSKGLLGSWKRKCMAQTHMDVESLFLRLLDGTPGELLGVQCRGAPLVAKRVASLGDMVKGTISDLPAGEGRSPDLALVSDGLDALKPDFTCKTWHHSTLQPSDKSTAMQSWRTLSADCPSSA